MQAEFSPKVDKELTRIKRRDKELAKRIEKKLATFLKDPQYPSLRLHKLEGLENLWSISISRSIRMICVIEDDVALFTDIGTHDEVYRKS